MKIEGIPAGWEIVRIGLIQPGEWFLNTLGNPVQADASGNLRNYIIIRKIAPVCVWPRGVFADGWLSEDQDVVICWTHEKPTASPETEMWECGDCVFYDCCNLLGIEFRSDLPWTERIVQVGPGVETVEK